MTDPGFPKEGVNSKRRGRGDLMEFHPKCFTELSEFSDKNISHHSKRARTCYNSTSKIHRIFKLSLIHASVIHQIPSIASSASSHIYNVRTKVKQHNSMVKPAFEFSHDAQSWQCWHFCTTSNESKLEVFANDINFTTNVHLS